jgi:hypothetical protein
MFTQTRVSVRMLLNTILWLPNFLAKPRNYYNIEDSVVDFMAVLYNGVRRNDLISILGKNERQFEFMSKWGPAFISQQMKLQARIASEFRRILIERNYRSFNEHSVRIEYITRMDMLLYWNLLVVNTPGLSQAMELIHKSTAQTVN